MGSAVIVGWILDVAWLKSLSSDVVSMKANTALTFVLAGMSLLFRSAPGEGKQRLTALLLACLVGLIGLTNVLQYVFTWNAGIDQLLFNEPQGTIGTFSAGRMSFNTAINFCFLGLSLLALKRRTRLGDGLGQVLALAVGLLGVLGLLAYIYGVSGFSGHAVYAHMALYTAGTFILLSVGVICLEPGDVERKKLEQLLLKSENEHAELKRAQDSLHESEEKYRAVLENLAEGVGIVDGEERFRFANRAAETIFGVPAGELVGRSIQEFVDPHEFEEIRSQTVRRRKGETASYEMQIIRPDGENRYLLTTLSPFIGKDGTFVTSIGVFRDLTERKRAEEVVKDSEDRFRMVFENVFDGISIYSEDPDPLKRRLVECNERYAAMAGRTREELLQLGNTQGLQRTLEGTADNIRLDSLTKGTAYQGSLLVGSTGWKG